jgi:hypothetical protein
MADIPELDGDGDVSVTGSDMSLQPPSTLSPSPLTSTPLPLMPTSSPTVNPISKEILLQL